MLIAFALLAASLSPQVGDLTLPPENSALLAIVEGRGVQIYTCDAGPGYAWTFKAPEAQLFNLATGKQIGHHDAGPTWTLEDGSSVTGTMISKAAGDTPADVPWLLLRAQPNAGKDGVLTHVTLIRRFSTQGGVAPETGCDAGHLGQTLRVPYTARYSFYGDPQQSQAVSGKAVQQ